MFDFVCVFDFQTVVVEEVDCVDRIGAGTKQVKDRWSVRSGLSKIMCNEI